MRYIAALILLLLFTSSAMAAYVNITIYGTNQSTAQANITKYGSNVTVNVQAWNTSYVKNITINTANASGDTIAFNISNVTKNTVQELLINGTSYNGYLSGNNGMLNFTLNQTTGNRTYVIRPAMNIQPGNLSWAYIWNNNLFASQAVKTGINVEDTIYQNGNSYRLVSMCVSQAGAAATKTDLLSGVMNPPTTVISRTQGTYACVWGIIAPNQYYKTTDDDVGAITYNSWLEWS